MKSTGDNSLKGQECSGHLSSLGESDYIRGSPFSLTNPYPESESRPESSWALTIPLCAHSMCEFIQEPALPLSLCLLSHVHRFILSLSFHPFPFLFCGEKNVSVHPWHSTVYSLYCPVYTVVLMVALRLRTQSAMFVLINALIHYAGLQSFSTLSIGL